jgi:type II secretory pathway component GspD/PulD (secretin)
LFVPVLFAALVVGPALGEDRPSAEQKRGAYVVKHAAAKDVAAVLAKQFKGAADIQVGPEGTSNTLLVIATPAVFDEVMKVLELLDRKPRTVAVEVFVVALPPKKSDDKQAADIDEKDLSGPIDNVAKALNSMQANRKVASVKRIQFNSQEGQLATFSVGEMVPYTTGTTVRGDGVVTKNVAYRNTGTRIRVTPRVGTDKSITLDLRVEESSLVTPQEGVVVGEDGKGNRLIASEFPVASLSTKVAVASGKAALAKGTKSTAKSSAGAILVIVGARVVEPK